MANLLDWDNSIIGKAIVIHAGLSFYLLGIQRDGIMDDKLKFSLIMINKNKMKSRINL